MDKERWNILLERLTSGVHQKFDGYIKDDNHIDIAYKFLLKHNLDNKDVEFLDLGCGPDARLQEKLSSNYCGADYDFPNKIGNYVICDGHTLPFEDKNFDVVFCSHMLEHTIAPIIVIDEIKRVLRDDGRAIISVPCYPSFLGDDHNYVLTPGGWKHLFVRSGFVVIDDETVKNCLSVLLKKRLIDEPR